MRWDKSKEQENKEKTKDFQAKMAQGYDFKKAYAARRAWEFYNHPDVAGRCYVAVGGLDSITLFLFLRSIGINVPGASVSMLEDQSIQRIHKVLGIKSLKPAKNPQGKPYGKIEVVREFGFPVLSKETAGKINLLQHPTEKNATVRHAIMTGETGEYGGFRKSTRMKMSQKWLEKFGGPENEREGTNYQTAPFSVSDLCCYYLKEKPCDDYAKENGRFPYMGLMASEGGRRQKALMLNGCNYISKDTKRSAPFAIFTRQDLLTLALEMQEWYHEHWEEFRPIVGEEAGVEIYGDPIHLETIVPAIYGKIVRDPLDMTPEEIEAYRQEHGGAEPEGQLRTTKAQRTGCQMCGFGIHLEHRPHRFDRIRYKNPKDGNVVKETPASWEADPEGGSVAIVPLNQDTMEPDGPAEVFGDWQAGDYLARVLELIHPNRQINVPDLAAMVRAAAEDGLDLCEYCQAPYMCRDCIVKEWKEDPGGE